MTAARRFAIYWTPGPSHPLWRAGCEWLGRDPADASFHCAPREATDAPRRYGFHATLKAPMALREGVSEAAFVDAVQALAHRTHRFAMPPLQVDWLSDFIALRPIAPVDSQHPLRRLADACVRELDSLRAPTGEAQLQRRLQTGAHSAELERSLRQWGYPHVFDHWRLHLTLSNPLPRDAAGEALRQRLVAEATRFFAAALEAPLACDSICVFVEPAAGLPFALTHRFALAA